jgi:hypothetical protein
MPVCTSDPRLADADQHEVRQPREIENSGNAQLRQQHGAVRGTVGVERNRHQIGFAVGALGNEVNDIEWTRRKLPRQAAEQRHELDLRRRHRRQMADHGGQSSTVTDTNDLTCVALQDRMQKARTGKCQSLQRKSGLAEIGRHLHRVEMKARLERFLELHTFRNRAVDEDTDQTIAARARDQPVRLDGGNVQSRRDLALREAAGVMQPGGARRQAHIVLKRRNRLISAAHISTL